MMPMEITITIDVRARVRQFAEAALAAEFAASPGAILLKP